MKTTKNNKMMQRIMMMAVLAIGLFFTSLVQAQTNKLITKDSAGNVKIGMTVDQARAAVRPLILGNGVNEFEGDMRHRIKQGQNLVMTILVGGTASIYQGQITEIVVWGKRFQTAEGVRVGMALGDAEKKYGKVEKIEKNEQNDFEYVTFANHPKGILFTLEISGETVSCQDAGIYDTNETTATKYNDEVYVKFIEIQKISMD